MANEQNLKPLTTKKAREIGRLGGIKSGEVRQARKTLKEELLTLLSQGNTQNNMTLSLIEKAMCGDTKAFEVVRDTIGEKPKETTENINVDITLEEYLKQVSGNDEY